jgi:hypothetical protein
MKPALSAAGSSIFASSVMSLSIALKFWKMNTASAHPLRELTYAHEEDGHMGAPNLREKI